MLLFTIVLSLLLLGCNNEVPPYLYAVGVGDEVTFMETTGTVMDIHYGRSGYGYSWSGWYATVRVACFTYPSRPEEYGVFTVKRNGDFAYTTRCGEYQQVLVQLCRIERKAAPPLKGDIVSGNFAQQAKECHPVK